MAGDHWDHLTELRMQYHVHVGAFLKGPDLHWRMSITPRENQQFEPIVVEHQEISNAVSEGVRQAAERGLFTPKP